jgi:DNA-binding response OmpR family regulator
VALARDEKRKCRRRALGTTRTLDSHACPLRHKLRARGDQLVINVWGVGYRLIEAPHV